MENYIEVNPTIKKQEICLLLEKMNCQYEIHNSDTDKEYEYLDEHDICITVLNPSSKYPLYIDLEESGEFRLTYDQWHQHYFAEEWDYDNLRENLIDILTNNRCVIIISSSKRCLLSKLSRAKIGKDYNYSNDIKELPEEFQKEINELKGKVELVYWDTKESVAIDVA